MEYVRQRHEAAAALLVALGETDRRNAVKAAEDNNLDAFERCLPQWLNSAPRLVRGEVWQLLLDSLLAGKRDDVIKAGPALHRDAPRAGFPGHQRNDGGPNMEKSLNKAYAVTLFDRIVDAYLSDRAAEIQKRTTEISRLRALAADREDVAALLAATRPQQRVAFVAFARNNDRTGFEESNLPSWLRKAPTSVRNEVWLMLRSVAESGNEQAFIDGTLHPEGEGAGFGDDEGHVHWRKYRQGPDMRFKENKEHVEQLISNIADAQGAQQHDALVADVQQKLEDARAEAQEALKARDDAQAEAKRERERAEAAERELETVRKMMAKLNIEKEDALADADSHRKRANELDRVVGMARSVLDKVLPTPPASPAQMNPAYSQTSTGKYKTGQDGNAGAPIRDTRPHPYGNNATA